MVIRGLDIQKQGNKIVACIKHEDGAKVTICEENEECFLKWFWDTIQTEGIKGSFEKTGGWK